MQNSVHRWSVPSLCEPYWDALRNETWPRQKATLTRGDRGIAMLCANPQTKPRKHQGCAKQPYHRKNDRGDASRDVVCEFADDAQRRGPRKVRRPRFIENCADGHNEIERGCYPDPILRGGATTSDRR